MEIMAPARIVEQWTDLVDSSESKRDTTIVCKDGTLTWNRLFLASWSHLVKNFLLDSGYMCAGCDTDLVLLLPDYEVGMVKQVLQWSRFGEIQLDSAMLLPFMGVLNALGVSVDLTQSRLTKATECFKCKACVKCFAKKDDLGKHIESCHVETQPDSQDFTVTERNLEEPEVVTILDSDSEEEREEAKDDDSGNCSNVHSEDTHKADEQGKSSDSGPDKTDEAEGGGGSHDDLLLDLLSEEKDKAPFLRLQDVMTRKGAERFLEKPWAGEKPKEDKGDEITSTVQDEGTNGGDESLTCSENHSTLKTYSRTVWKKGDKYRLTKADCSACSSGFSQLSILKAHISVKHFKGQIMDAFADGLTCVICKTTMGDRDKLVRHVGTTHNVVLTLVSNGVRAQLQGMEKAIAKRKSERGAMKTTVKKANTDSDRPRTKTRSGPCKLKDTDCQACAAGFVAPWRLRRHLANIHYGRKLIGAYGSDGGTGCALCSRKFAKTLSRPDLTGELTYHIGITHDKLKEFLPSDVQEQLDGMSLGAASRIRRRVVKKKTKSKPGPFKLSEHSFLCKVCTDGFQSPKLLRIHLSQVHYSAELVEKYFDGDRCKICEKEIPRSTMGRKNQLGYHVGISHGRLAEVLSPAVRRQLDEMATSSEPAKAKSTVARLPTKRASAKPRKRWPATVNPAGVPYNLPESGCGLCRRGFDKLGRLKRHVATHIAARIVEANGGSDRWCFECGKVFAERSELCRHVGIVHGKVDEYLGRETVHRLTRLQEEIVKGGRRTAATEQNETTATPQPPPAKKARQEEAT